MVRFLLEHSLPLEDKTSSFDFASTSAEHEDLPSAHEKFVERGRLTNDALHGLLE